MPEFETIPAEENALLAKPKAGLRRVIVAAAALSFALGAVAATAVGSTSTAAMDLHGSTTKISDAHITHISSGKCLTVNGEDNLELAKCGTGNGMQIKTELDGTEYCVTALTGDHKDFRLGDQMGIWSCDAEHNGRKGYPEVADRRRAGTAVSGV